MFFELPVVGFVALQAVADAAELFGYGVAHGLGLFALLEM